MKAQALEREQKQLHEFQTFQAQVKTETTNLLRQIGDLQTIIGNNDAAQNRRAQRAEDNAAAREKRMDAKLNKIMASLQQATGQKPCPASDSEDEKSEYRTPAAAPSAPSASTAADADSGANTRGRTRSPAPGARTAA